MADDAPAAIDPTAAAANVLPSGFDLKTILSQQAGADSELTAAKDAYNKALQPGLQRQGTAIEAVRESMRQADTMHLADLPPAPDLQMKKLSAGRAMGAIVMGLLMGKAAKVGGWETAAKALGETVKNWREGQMDQAQGNLAQYKTAMERVKYHNDQLRDHLSEIQEHAKTNLTLAQAEIEVMKARLDPSVQKIIDKQASVQQKLATLETVTKMATDQEKAHADLAEKMAAAMEKRATAKLREAQADRVAKGLPMNPGSGKQAAARTMLVEGASKNALTMLDQIESSYGAAPKASLYFGSNADGLFGKAGQEMGRAFLSDKQKKIDADFGAMIDEAIPALTGGLRGSDAYRKFLIEQMPKQGDSDASAKEKLRAFRQNIQGMQSSYRQAFQGDLPKFAADPESAAKAATGADEAPDIDALIEKYAGGE